MNVGRVAGRNLFEVNGSGDVDVDIELAPYARSSENS